MWTETLGTIIYNSPFHVNKANKKKSKVLWSRVAFKSDWKFPNIDIRIIIYLRKKLASNVTE